MFSPSKSSRSVFGNAGKTVVSGVHSRAVFDPNGVVPTAPARVGPKPNLGTHRGSLSAADLLGRTPLDRALASESQLSGGSGLSGGIARDVSDRLVDWLQSEVRLLLANQLEMKMAEISASR